MENIGTLLALLYIFFFVRLVVTIIRRDVVEWAILTYDFNLISEPPGGVFVDPFEVMEPSFKTYWRLWDWGCKRIVDGETYKLIKRYIVW